MCHDFLLAVINFALLAAVFVLAWIVDLRKSRKYAVTPLDPSPVRDTVLTDNLSREQSASRAMERWLTTSQM